MNDCFKVLSLGGGVQSTAMLYLVQDGVLSKPDIVIFADTGSDSGSFNLDGNTISWYRLADQINLTVTDTDGDLTNILIPIGSLLLPEPTNETTTE